MSAPLEPLAVERLEAPSPEDRAAILMLEHESFSSPWSAESFDRMLAIPVGRLFVTRTAGGRIVAFCSCWLIHEELHINTVAVASDRRRRGVATHLLREVLQRTGATKATLEVRRSNAAALALYRHLGFKVTAVRQGYYQNPEEDGLILWLDP